MLRLLIISHMYPSPANPANGSFVHRHARALADAGVQVEVLCPVPWAPAVLRLHPRWRRYEAPHPQVLDGIPISYPRFVRPPGRWFHGPSADAMYLALRGPVARVRHRFPFDLIHGHMLVPDGAAAARLGRTYGVPVVCTARGDDVNIAPGWNKAATRATSAAVSGCHQVVAVSQGLAQAMVPLGQPRRPVKVVYTGTDLNPLSGVTQAQLRAELALPVDRVLLLLVGALYRNKGVVELAAAAAQLVAAGLPIHVAYVGSGSHRHELEAEVARLGIANHVTLCGQQPHAAVQRYMAACDAVVLPSYNEGLPNVLVEAHAVGRPVVATPVGGIPEVVQDGVSGILCPPRDVSALVQALRRLVTNQELREQMGAAGRAFVSTRFTWEQNARAYIDIYQQLLTKG